MGGHFSTNFVPVASKDFTLADFNKDIYKIVFVAKEIPFTLPHYVRRSSDSRWKPKEWKTENRVRSVVYSRIGIRDNFFLNAVGLTYLLTLRIRVLLEKPTGSQLVRKFPAFYGTRRFITAFTTARHLSLFWASWIQSKPPHTTSWRSILILSSHLSLDLPSGLFPLSFLTKTLYKLLSSPYALHALPISFFLILSPEQYCVSSTDH